MRASLVGLVALHLTNRLCLVASAVEAESGHLRASLVLAGVVFVAWAADRVIGTLARNAIERDLTERAVRHLLRANTFFVDARREYETILVGIFESARFRATAWPVLVADAVAALVVAGVAFQRGIAWVLGVFLVGLSSSFAALVLARRRIERRSRSAWELRERFSQQVLDGLEGAQELTTALPQGEYELRVTESLRVHRRSAWLLAAETLLVGRAPLLVGVVVACALAYFIGGFDPFASGTHGAVVASMLPPFAGLASGTALYFETRGPMSAVTSFLGRPLRTYGTVVPEKLSPVTLERVSVLYDSNEALRNVSLELTGLVGVAGANGCGKSSLLRAVVGLVVPSSGTLRLGGVAHDSIAWPDVRKRIAYLPQKPYFPPAATVREALCFLLGDVDDDELRAQLERVGIWHVLRSASEHDPLDASIDGLSSGERQRVALARVLARRADVYLLDEPDAYLDRDGLRRLREILTRLAEDAIVVVAAHDEELLSNLPRVVRLERGAVMS